MQKTFIWRERLKVNQKETDESHKINLIMDLCCSDNEKVRLNFFLLHISNIMLVLLFQTYFIITSVLWSHLSQLLRWNILKYRFGCWYSGLVSKVFDLDWALNWTHQSIEHHLLLITDATSPQTQPPHPATHCIQSCFHLVPGICCDHQIYNIPTTVCHTHRLSKVIELL